MPYHTKTFVGEDVYDNCSEFHGSNISLSSELPSSPRLHSSEAGSTSLDHLRCLGRPYPFSEDAQSNYSAEAGGVGEGMLVGHMLRPHCEANVANGTHQGHSLRSAGLTRADELGRTNKALEFWYSWIEARSSSASIRWAVADPVLREALGRSVDRRWGKRKHLAMRASGGPHANRQEIYDSFLAQLTRGCGNNQCTNAFCHKNVPAKIARDKRQLMLLAQGLTERALVRPEQEAYQPHVRVNYGANQPAEGVRAASRSVLPEGAGSTERGSRKGLQRHDTGSKYDDKSRPRAFWYTILDRIASSSSSSSPSTSLPAATEGQGPNRALPPSPEEYQGGREVNGGRSFVASASGYAEGGAVTEVPHPDTAHTALEPASLHRHYPPSIAASRHQSSTHPPLRDHAVINNQLLFPSRPESTVLSLKSKTRQLLGRPGLHPGKDTPFVEERPGIVQQPQSQYSAQTLAEMKAPQSLGVHSSGVPLYPTLTPPPPSSNKPAISPAKGYGEPSLALRRASSVTSASSDDSQESFVSSSSMYDSDGDPLVGATKLDKDIVERINALFSDPSSVTADSKYMVNTLRTVFSSPRAISASFQLEQRPRFRSVPMKTLNIDVQEALKFAYGWLCPDPSFAGPNKAFIPETLETFKSATLIALRRIEAKPIFSMAVPDTLLSLNSEVYEAMLEDACRVLGLLFLMLSPSFTSSGEGDKNPTVRNPYFAERKLFVRVAALIGKIVLSPQFAHTAKGTSPELPSYTVALITKRLSWLKRHWIHFFSIVPANVVHAWYSVILDYVIQLASQYYSSALSERASACTVTDLEHPLVPLLEFLRLLYEGNETILSGASTRLLPEEVECETSRACKVLERDDFASPEFVKCFDIEEEIGRWLRHARYQSSPEKEIGRIDPTVESNFFTPLIYPFLVPVSVKAEMLAVEMHSRLKLRYLSSFHRQTEVTQSQRLLHVDQFAEQSTLPSTDLAWPFFEANQAEMKAAMNPYLVLAVRRSHIVQDTMDLMRNNMHRLRYPFKVRFVAGGEDGVDLGGVQKEFFRQLMPRLLSPDYGLFVFADENPGAEGGQISGRESGYLWPNGATPHSTAEFEIVGALLGICFANGITLGKDIAPLSPLLFAQMTAGWLGTDDWSVEMLMRHLEPTFPALVSGLRVLLKWDEAQNEGMKVEDVFCRTFEITVYDPLKTTYRRYSGLKSLGLELPSSSSEFDDEDSLSLGNIPTGVEHANGYTTIPLIDNGSAIEVTSSNRRAYIRRYLQFLGDKYVRELVSALRSGFQQAADGIVYRMCQASELELLICGDDAPINIDELERVATYEEYDADHPVVRMFWRVVRSLTPRQHRKLLQFVMASDRLPLGGIDSLVFVIQRNGPDSDRLPTSLTCFSRLLLPAYASEQKMRRLLVTAIENAHGFGLV